VEKCGGSGNWAWPLEKGMVKLSAACLIQCAGFSRGHRQGTVGVSPHHTLILVNYGGATATEIVSFAAEVRERVFERFSVLLSPEVRLVGFDGSPLGDIG
jgi:UDP-N-acetylmuramate dehydrogenase